MKSTGSNGSSNPRITVIIQNTELKAIAFLRSRKQENGATGRRSLPGIVPLYQWRSRSTADLPPGLNTGAEALDGRYPTPEKVSPTGKGGKQGFSKPMERIDFFNMLFPFTSHSRGFLSLFG